MKSFFQIVFAGFVLCAGASAACADDGTITILSPDDVKLYREIFAAQNAGQLSKADALAKKLTDTSLIGYVEQNRILAPRYASKFPELQNWMQRYADHVDADKIYKLALKKRPKHGEPVNEPTNLRWRGASYDQESLPDTSYASPAAQKIDGQLRAFAKASQPDAAAAVVASLKPTGTLTQPDIDKLCAYVAAAYLADGHNAEALDMAESVTERGAENAPNSEWVAGLSAYRLGQFDKAAAHFQAYSQMTGLTAQNFAAANFWSARALMRSGKPQSVVMLLNRAATERTTFYGALAARVLGHDIGDAMAEASVDTQSFGALMQVAAAHRAIALWQIGRREAVDNELARAFSQMPATLDVTFAAVARILGYPTLEMRAAEDAAHNGVYLTSLYPVPSYQPSQGYSLDPALVLAFARQESRFDTEALSHSGARGIMQLMPGTAALVAGDKSLAGSNADKLNDPAFNMQLGQDYLRRLLADQNNSLFALAAAYNSGPGNLQRWMAAMDTSDDSLLFVESIPNAETRMYVKRVMMNLWMYRKRLNEPADGLDETASGQWPFYGADRPTVTADSTSPGKDAHPN